MNIEKIAECIRFWWHKCCRCNSFLKMKSSSMSCTLNDHVHCRDDVNKSNLTEYLSMSVGLEPDSGAKSDRFRAHLKDFLLKRA